jgi:hypothetical protein
MASTNEQAPPATPGLGGQISSFLGYIKPYRELMALLIGVVVAISGSISWAVSHFATAAQLQNLDCTTDSRINRGQLAVSDAILLAGEDTANRRLADLNKIDRKTPAETAEVDEQNQTISADIRQIQANLDKMDKENVAVLKCKSNKGAG